jgi:hypothetical protein
MRKYHLCSLLSIFLEIYIPCNPILSLVEFFFKKKLRHGSHPTLGANERYFLEKMETMIESMVKGKLKTKVQRLRKG